MPERAWGFKSPLAHESKGPGFPGPFCVSGEAGCQVRSTTSAPAALLFTESMPFWAADFVV